MTETNQDILKGIEEAAPTTGTFPAALFALLPIIPIVATIVSIVTFAILIFSPSKFPLLKNCPSNDPTCYWGFGFATHFLPFLVGTLSALLLWFIVAGLCRRLTAVDRASGKSYYAILNHLSDLNYYIDAFSGSEEPTPPAAPTPTPPSGTPVPPPSTPGTATPASVPPPSMSAAAPTPSGAPVTQPSTPDTATPASATPPAALVPPPSTPAAAPTPTPPPAAPAPPPSTPEQSPGGSNITKSMQEVMYYRDALRSALAKRGAHWILGSGYSQLWNLVDSAEEALIAVALPPKVVGDAIYDEMRLNDSKIVNSEEWTNKLRDAVRDLDSGAAKYLKPAAVVQQPGSGDAGLQQGAGTQQSGSGDAGSQQGAGTQQSGSGVGTLTNQEKESPEQVRARMILRAVRKTINDFDAEKWDGLISARNQLLGTMIFVGLVTYIFVELAILLQISPEHLVVAAVIALIGALAGLIGRLYTESQADTAIDDYRLSLARLAVTPLLSGVAAVIALLVVTKETDINGIYTFKTLVTNLVIAAGFGLAPNLLLDQLKKKTDQYKTDLQSTQATSGK